MSDRERAVSRAHNRVRCAVSCGLLIKPDRCSRCHKTGIKILGHHDDYNDALSVVWLCSDCHVKHHSKDISRGVLRVLHEKRDALAKASAHGDKPAI